MNANVFEAEPLDLDQQFGDAIDERLAAEKAASGMAQGVGGEAFAPAEADFKPQIVGAMGNKPKGVAIGWETSSRRRGSRVSTSPACRGRRVLPLRRP